MPLNFEAYADQLQRWPPEGRHILAQFDATTVVVYQAYHPSIGLPAARDGRFGDGWSRSRMTWVKPNFLWMMYRSAWATSERQEVVLALRLTRAGFDELLASAVASSFTPGGPFASREEWTAAVENSDVRLQWDPDHDPSGRPVRRRAIQLGVRRAALERFADEWIVGIEDITAFVREQHAHVLGGDLVALITPREEAYPVGAPEVRRRIGVDSA